MEFFDLLKSRNTPLFYFGLINLIAAFILFVFSVIRPLEFAGTNAWYKPIKFALSTLILAWSLGWYTGYLAQAKSIDIFNWVIIVSLAFEVIYIAWMASRGEASHYNISTPFYSAMFNLMAIGASAATLAVAYLGIQFFTQPLPELPSYYLWAIRLGICLFVFFSFEGFVMGSSGAHTVGAPDGGAGIPFLNWSLSWGDLRIAHFVGMHALQVLPLLAYFILKDVNWTIGLAAVYAILAIWILGMALQAKSLFGFLG